jgi:hypothetical protein
MQHTARHATQRMARVLTGNAAAATTPVYARRPLLLGCWRPCAARHPLRAPAINTWCQLRMLT